MKRKPIIPQLVRKPNRLRALYIISRRKLGKMTDEKVIVILSAAVFLLQLFIILTAVAAPMHASAQGSVKQVSIKPGGLQIGDRVPDVTITNIINYKTPTAKISDFKGKLLILEFWGTYCSNCVGNLQTVYELSDQFKDKAFILSVTSESESRVRSFLAAKSRLKELTITTVVGDKILKGLFPHQTVPHLVWISPEGTVLSITNAEYLTAANIEAALIGKPLSWLQKSNKPAYDYTKPLALDSKTPAVGYNMLKGNVAGAETRAGFEVIPGTAMNRFYAINHNILHLYSLALSRGDLIFSPNRRVLTVSDSSKYLYSKTHGYLDVWRLNNLYSYEAAVPNDVPIDKVRASMQKHLDVYLNLKTGIEERKVHCLVLQRQDNGRQPKISISKREVSLDPADEKPFIHNAPLKNLVHALNQIAEMPPVIDDTGYKKPIDLEFTKPLSDVAALNLVLKKQGLELVPEQRELEMFVLTENPVSMIN